MPGSTPVFLKIRYAACAIFVICGEFFSSFIMGSRRESLSDRDSGSCAHVGAIPTVQVRT
jgi:hypothetical protein